MESNLRLKSWLESVTGKTASGDVIGALQQLDAYAREHGAVIPLDLKHYLERRSYIKALAWLDQNTNPLP
jgi:hypothetical protein